MTDDPNQGPGPEDPSGIDEPHDVLAAEEFAMPAQEPGSFPSDPTGIREAHDVLAAEEFAMPSPGSPGDAPESGGSSFDVRSWLPAAGALTLLALVVWLRRR